MKNTKQFAFQTRYFHPFYKKDYGEIVIGGTATYDDSKHDRDGKDYDDEEYLFDFKIEVLMLNMSDIIHLYNSNQVLEETLLDIIKKSTYQHMSWVFKEELAAHYNEDIEIECASDSTDFTQHQDYPSAEELQIAFMTLKRTRQYNIPNPNTQQRA